MGPLNRLEWALRAEPEGRLQREPGRVAEGRRGVHLPHFTAGMMKKQPRRPVWRGVIYHSNTVAPQVRPAPKAMMSILSPRSILPEESASSRATATLAAEVLPISGDSQTPDPHERLDDRLWR